MQHACCGCVRRSYGTPGLDMGVRLYKRWITPQGCAGVPRFTITKVVFFFFATTIWEELEAQYTTKFYEAGDEKLYELPRDAIYETQTGLQDLDDRGIGLKYIR